jgi:hypothetical protein
MASKDLSVILVFNKKVRYLKIRPRYLSIVVLIIAFAFTAHTLFLAEKGGLPAASTTSVTSTTIRVTETQAPPATVEASTTTVMETSTTQETKTTTTSMTTTIRSTTTTIVDYSWLPTESKTYLINRHKCSGWSENPCGDPDHLADYNGTLLVCSYTDALPAGTRISDVRVTLSQLVGTTGNSEIEFKFNNNTLGTISGNTNCDSDGPREWVIKSPHYLAGEANTISAMNLAPGGWATIGDEEGPSTVLFRVNVTYVNEAAAATYTTTTTTSTLPPGVLFRETFNEGNDDRWRRVNGDWTVESGKYTLRERVKNAFSVIEGDWTDYTVEAEIRLNEGDEAGVAFRAVDDTHYYACILKQSQNEICLYDFGEGKARRLSTTKQEPVAGETFNMKVNVQGSDINCYYDGKLKIGVKDDAYPRGGIGVYASKTIASFDNILVRTGETTTTITQPTTTTITQATTTTTPGAVKSHTLNPDLTHSQEYWRFSLWDKDVGETRPTGRWMLDGGNPGGVLEVKIGRDKSTGVGGYWVHEFTTDSKARGAECRFDWRVAEFGEELKSLRVYLFLDEDFEEPVKGSEVWVSDELTGITDWSNVKVDCTSRLQSRGRHYLKLAVWSDTDSKFRGPYTIQFDNALVEWIG